MHVGKRARLHITHTQRGSYRLAPKQNNDSPPSLSSCCLSGRNAYYKYRPIIWTNYGRNYNNLVASDRKPMGIAACQKVRGGVYCVNCECEYIGRQCRVCVSWASNTFPYLHCRVRVKTITPRMECKYANQNICFICRVAFPI